ncbi:MAG: hypothetical protein ACM3SY_14860 [Candidatus Omnitrophota bacterium]
MDIIKKNVSLNLTGFNIGKILQYQGNDFIFPIDTGTGEIIQVSSLTHTVIHRIKLTDIVNIRQIDTALLDGEHLLLTDSRTRKLYRLKVSLETGSGHTFSLSLGDDYPLDPGSQITAMGVHGDRYLLLDKGFSLIRSIKKDFSDEIMVGSRMGYIDEYGEEENQRLGFEFPEDMAVWEDHIVVSDSGNKRLVVLDRNLKQEKIIRLSDFPFKILSWDNDRVIVSDFDCSIIIVSLRYGFIHKQEIDYPVDFYPTLFHSSFPLHRVVGSENHRSTEFVELTFPDVSVEAIAKEAGNVRVSMKIDVDCQRFDEARERVKQHPSLLIDYIKYTTDSDSDILDRLTQYIQTTFQSIMDENHHLHQELSRFALQFIKKYKSIPDSDDMEAGHIDKEQIRRRMFLLIRQYRKNLKTLVDLRNAVRRYPEHFSLLTRLADQRFEHLKMSIVDSIQGIERNFHSFNEEELLKFIVDYWFFCEEDQEFYKGNSFGYEKLFDNKFLLSILNDFYYNIALLFLKRYKIEQYISFADREITMYSDKMGIFNSFVTQLIALKKYDDVLRMLKKFPDQNKENVNYYYYSVYLNKGDMDRAFAHLKKELDLYSHRIDLIPKLVKLNKLSAEDVQRYLNKVLEKSTQSIDNHLIAARAILNTGDKEKAEYYVDRELELFPENKEAVRLKYELFSRRIGENPSGMDAAYVHKAWEIFKSFMKNNRNETLAMGIIGFFAVLNFLSYRGEDAVDFNEIRELRDRVIVDSYKKEIDAYLSFMKHFHGMETEGDITKFDRDVYLLSYSTGNSAYDYFFDEAKRLKDEGKWDEMFEIVEDILKYNPGDEGLFNFLEIAYIS